jgi:hypothetical protein
MTLRTVDPVRAAQGRGGLDLRDRQPLLEHEAGGPVDGIFGEADPFESVKR